MAISIVSFNGMFVNRLVTLFICLTKVIESCEHKSVDKYGVVNILHKFLALAIISTKYLRTLSFKLVEY